MGWGKKKTKKTNLEILIENCIIKDENIDICNFDYVLYGERAEAQYDLLGFTSDKIISKGIISPEGVRYIGVCDLKKKKDKNCNGCKYHYKFLQDICLNPKKIRNYINRFFSRHPDLKNNKIYKNPQNSYKNETK